MNSETTKKEGQGFDPVAVMKALDKADIKKIVAKVKADNEAKNKKLTIKDILMSKKAQDFFLECEAEEIKLSEARQAFSDFIGFDIPQKTLRRVLNELGLYQKKETKEGTSCQSKGEKESNEGEQVDHGDELVEQTDSTSGEDSSDFNIDVQVELPDSFAPAQHSSFNEDEDIYNK